MSYIRSTHHADDRLFQTVVEKHADLPRPNVAIDIARPSVWQRIAATLRTWQARRRSRRELAQIDARSLRELGFSPELVEYELRRPFWRPLRDWRS
jgi:uncharacterized protein YjiS (DUF1127 family)